MPAAYTVSAGGNTLSGAEPTPAYYKPSKWVLDGKEYATQADYDRALASRNNAMAAYGLPTSGGNPASPTPSYQAPGVGLSGTGGSMTRSPGDSYGLLGAKSGSPTPGSPTTSAVDLNRGLPGLPASPGLPGMGVPGAAPVNVDNYIPGFNQLSQTASNRIADLMAGKLPAGVNEQIQQGRAQQAVASGMPGSSRISGTLQGNATLRDLGMNSLQAGQQGFQDLLSLLQAESGNLFPTANASLSAQVSREGNATQDALARAQMAQQNTQFGQTLGFNREQLGAQTALQQAQLQQQAAQFQANFGQQERQMANQLGITEKELALKMAEQAQQGNQFEQNLGFNYAQLGQQGQQFNQTSAQQQAQLQQQANQFQQNFGQQERQLAQQLGISEGQLALQLAQLNAQTANQNQTQSLNQLTTLAGLLAGNNDPQALRELLQLLGP